jgi:hypothetical protein
MVVVRSMRLIEQHGLFVSPTVLPQTGLPLSLEGRRLALDPLGLLSPQL